MEPHHVSPESKLQPVAALRPKDLVAVLAPAGPCSAGDLKAGLDLLSARYRLRPAENLFARDGYLAGSDARRQEAVNRALADPDIRGVFCARGGYGVQRILDQLQGDLLRADPKPIIGFSDITALLCWARAQGVVSIHGPVVTQLPRLKGGDLEHLFSLLEDPGYAPKLQGTAMRASVAAEDAQGPLVGGNLSLLGALAGTPWAPDLQGSLLALEEIGEAPYRLDRLLTTLEHQAPPRSTRGLAGVAVGELCDCGSAEGKGPSGLETVVERLAMPGRPLLFGLPFGHGERNLAFPIGAMALLGGGAQTLSWEGGVVA